jgi:pimeloyl-ACP methyl ester carboxylesterase
MKDFSITDHAPFVLFITHDEEEEHFVTGIPLFVQKIGGTLNSLDETGNRSVAVMTKTLQERWATNGEVRIHYVVGNEDEHSDKVPLLHIPDGFGGGESFAHEIERLAPRTVVAMSPRGRSKSGGPESGYRPEDHLSDVEAVVEAAGLERFALHAFSLGMPLALLYASRHPERVTGIVLGDHPAMFQAKPAEWLKKYEASPPGTFQMQAVYATQREAIDLPLWDQIGVVTCPVLVMQGMKEGRMLSEEDAALYRQHLPQVEIVQMMDSTHALWEPDFERYAAVICEFVATLD